MSNLVQPVLWPFFYVLCVTSSANACGFYCKDWCEVAECHRMPCDPSEPKDCPGTVCAEDCEHARLPEEEESPGPPAKLLVIPIMSAVMATVCLISCCWYRCWYKPRRKRREKRAQEQAQRPGPWLDTTEKVCQIPKKARAEAMAKPHNEPRHMHDTGDWQGGQWGREVHMDKKDADVAHRPWGGVKRINGAEDHDLNGKLAAYADANQVKHHQSHGLPSVVLDQPQDHSRQSSPRSSPSNSPRRTREERREGRRRRRRSKGEEDAASAMEKGVRGTPGSTAEPSPAGTPSETPLGSRTPSPSASPGGSPRQGRRHRKRGGQGEEASHDAEKHQEPPPPTGEVVIHVDPANDTGGDDGELHVLSPQGTQRLAQLLESLSQDLEKGVKFKRAQTGEIAFQEEDGGGRPVLIRQSVKHVPKQSSKKA